MQDPAKFTGSEVRYRDPESQQVHFAIAFKGASWTDPDMLTLMLMQTILGSHAASTLYPIVHIFSLIPCSLFCAPFRSEAQLPD